MMLTTFMTVLTSSVANIALPHIAGGLSVSTHEVSWVLTSYLVAASIMLAATGWLSSFIGRKRFLAISVTMFILSSALCGMAQSLPQLILGRILQGLSGGSLMPLAQAIMLESFPREKRAAAMSLFGVGVIVAPIIGPIIGGWITDNYSWRWIFYINVPVGIIGLIMQEMVLEDPPYLKRNTAAKVDYAGLVLMAVGLSAFQLVIDKGQTVDWLTDVWIRVGTVVFSLALPAFAWWEVRKQHPLMNLRLLRNRNLALGSVLYAVVGAMTMGSTAIMPIFMQQLLGYPALQSGMAMMPRGIGSMLAMIIVGKIISKLGNRLTIFLPFFGMAATLIVFSHMNLNIGLSNVMWPLFFNGLMMSMVFVPMTTISMSNLRQSDIQQASGIFTLLRNIGSSVGISLMFTMQERMAQVHQTALASNISQYGQQFIEWSAKVKGITVSPAAVYGLAYKSVVVQATLMSFTDCFRWLAYAALLTAPFALLFRGSRHVKDLEEMEKAVTTEAAVEIEAVE